MRIGAVAALHLVILYWALMSKRVILSAAPPTSIAIEIVELPTPPPAPAPDPEPEPPPNPTPEPPDKPSPQPVIATPTPAPPTAPISNDPETPPAVEPSSRAMPERPTVLTQKDPATAPDAEAAAATPAENADADTVTPDQMAGVLRQLECQKLTHRTVESCPRTDPFTAWASNTERARIERNTDWDRSYRSKSVIDKFYEREVRERLPWPDEDLFADPMAPGAYNAERIRRGQEPLWSKEMRDGFRKPDE